MSKYFVNEQDSEDYEQELAIQEWMRRQGISTDEMDFASINGKGNMKHVGDIGAFSLNQSIGDEGGGTFADIIPSDEMDEIEELFEPEEEEIEVNAISLSLETLLSPLNLKKDAQEWATETYKRFLIGKRRAL